MEKVSTARIALKWGLIYGFLAILVNTLIYTFNLMSHQWINMAVSLVLSFGILYFAYSEFKNFNNGFMSYGEGIGLGLLLFATAGVLVSIFDFIYKNYIDTSVVEKQMQMMEEQYIKSGMSPEMIDQAVEAAKPWVTGPIASLLAVFSFLLTGLICSLIMAAIMKKSKPVFE